MPPSLHAARGPTRSQIISIISARFSRIITIILSQIIVKRNSMVQSKKANSAVSRKVLATVTVNPLRDRKKPIRFPI
jgi:hypothetical protein